MKELPILYSTDMVKAILDGRKTVTRRICKDQTARKYIHVENCEQYPSTLGEGYTGWAKDCGHSFLIPTKPRYQKGDLLWIRETYRINMAFDDMPLKSLTEEDIVDLSIQRRADAGDKFTFGRWRSSRFMPKWATRLWLEVLSVRAERLKDMSFNDIRLEGLECPTHDFEGGFCCSPCGDLARAWIDLWDSLNAKRGYPWESNPWVWRYEFKKIKHPE